MEWLNYHHLLYFWTVAKRGSITEASKELRLAHPTISGQIHQLEQVLGEKLLVRKGRNLVMTDAGRVAYRYADAIFALGREFLDTVKGRSTGQPIRLVVGISDVFARSIVHRILEPAFHLEQEVRLVFREDRSMEAFLGELAMNAVDVVISGAPAGPGTPVRVFSHPLGECGTSFFASAALARARRHNFPRSLDGAPFLIPGASSAFRRVLEDWFRARRIQPKVVAELDDAALANVFGEAGLGVFAAPDVVEREVSRRYKVHLVGRAKEVRQRFFAISVERQIRHPAVAAICEVARKQIFG